MDFDKLNKWLSLIANFGVLVGLIFLIVEIQQSNSIANREATSEIASMGSDLNAKVIENPDFALLRSMLRNSDPDLSPSEEEQAVSWTLMQVNYWSLVGNSYENGLVSEDSYTRQHAAALRMIRRYPGMKQLLEETMSEINSNSGASEFLRSIVDSF